MVPSAWLPSVLWQQGMGLELSSNIVEGLKMMKELSVADFHACIQLQVDSETHCSTLRRTRQTWVLFVGLEGVAGRGGKSNEYKGLQLAASLFSQARLCNCLGKLRLPTARQE